jgi:hypothetical protein
MEWPLGSPAAVLTVALFAVWRQRNALRLRCYLLEQKYIYGLPVDRAIAAQLFRDAHLLGWSSLFQESHPDLARTSERLASEARRLGSLPPSRLAGFWDKPVYLPIQSYEHAPLKPTRDLSDDADV